MCKKCERGFVLSENSESCLNLNSISSDFDSNCNDYKEKINCTACTPGYYFENEECVPCDSSSGCFYCNPDDPTKCIVCRPEYYMNEF